MIYNYSDIGIYTVESKEQFRLLNKYADLYERKINVVKIKNVWIIFS